MCRRRILLVVAALALMVAVLFALDALPVFGRSEIGNYEPPYPPHEHVATKVVSDEKPAFRIDPDKPYRIEFGRGSGWHGLETVQFAEDGRVVLHRMTFELR